MDARKSQHASEASLSRRRRGQGHSPNAQRLEATVKEGEGLLRHARADASRTQQKGATKRAGSFGVRPADGDEFASIEAFRLDPRAAVIGQIVPVQPLRDHAFEAVSASGSAEGLAVAALMIREFDSVGWFRKERSQTRLSLAEGQARQIFAVELEEVEGEIDQTGAAAIRGLLHSC
jgi:hypothetical protein